MRRLTHVHEKTFISVSRARRLHYQFFRHFLKHLFVIDALEDLADPWQRICLLQFLLCWARLPAAFFVLTRDLRGFYYRRRYISCDILAILKSILISPRSTIEGELLLLRILRRKKRFFISRVALIGWPLIDSKLERFASALSQHGSKLGNDWLLPA